MSIQWNFIAGYLYVEICIVLALMLPIISPKLWSQFLMSRLFITFKNHAGIYFCVSLGVLSLFMFDSIREMRKYSHTTDAGHSNLPSEMKNSVKLFRAQRNFYITGFAIFLSFVIRRWVALILNQAELVYRSESLIKQTENIHDQAKKASVDADLYKTQLKISESMLHEEKAKAEQLNEELQEWKIKYAELSTKIKGIGDE